MYIGGNATSGRQLAQITTFFSYMQEKSDFFFEKIAFLDRLPQTKRLLMEGRAQPKERVLQSRDLTEGSPKGYRRITEGCS